MSFDRAVIARLAVPEVEAIAADRVTWMRRLSSLPAVTLQVIARASRDHLKGADDMVETLLQADCWALKHGDASDLCDAVTGALRDPDEAAGISFWRATIESVSDFAAEDVDGKLVHRTRADIRLRHTA